jgi:EAL domain-containing protein (putative c-di-GMP-specific phosphodiesterase class I)
MANSVTILVIDDEEDIGEFVSATALKLGLHCCAATHAAALPELLTPDVTLILLDLMMPEMDGVEALRLLSELHCKAGIVLMSGISGRILETAERLAGTLHLSVVGRLAKPFRVAELESLLRSHNFQKAVLPRKPLVGAPIPDQELRLAVQRNELVLHYQPQIEIATEAVIGVEALVRWEHPVRGLIGPDSFIGRMEELGIIDDLGWLVAERALEEVKQFAGKGHAIPRLGLNTSVNSLCDLRFPDRFSALLNGHDVTPEDVILEITESSLLKELSHTLEVLTRLRMKGVKLSIDDFGTGYAMMQQLVNIPATELKIDRLFVMNMRFNNIDHVMVQKSIEIGHALGMNVTAEGVETEEQLRFLREGGCDFAQGNLFTPPLPPQEFLCWLAEHHSRLACQP